MAHTQVIWPDMGIQVIEATPITTEMAVKYLELLILPFAWHVIKRLSSLGEKLSKQSEDLLALKVALIGIDGKNGMRSELNQLKADTERREHHGEESREIR